MSSQFCNLCGQPLGSDFRLFPREGSKGLAVCRTCLATRECCVVCGVPLAAAHTHLSDGRPICLACGASAITDPLVARALYEQVIELVTAKLGLRVYIRPGFSLCSPNEMGRLQRRIAQDDGEEPTHGRLLGAYLKLGPRREIVVEAGLPRLLMIKVIAHEYAHAWQGENSPFLAKPILQEGFCEWVAYKVLGELGAADAQQIQTAASGFYASALRALLALEATGGAAMVVTTVRDQRD